MAQAALVQLGPTFLLVGQAAHLLQDSSACEKVYLVCGWEATKSVLRDLFLPFGQPLFLYGDKWQHMMDNLLSGCHHARSGGEEESPSWR